MPTSRPAPKAMESQTLREILGQPEAWAGAIKAVEERGDTLRRLLAGAPAVFCGCGTSRYLAISAARVHQEVTGMAALPLAASELFLAPEGVLLPGHRGPLVAFSRSGETTETILAARFYRERGWGPVIGVTTQADSSLGAASDLALVLPWANDQSVVMTRSFTTMLLASWMGTGLAAGDETFLGELRRLPALGARAVGASRPLAAELGRDTRLRQFVFLGLGGYLGLACEGMLKLKEMTRVVAEAYAPMEFRHGPVSIVDEATAVVLLATSRGAGYHGDLLADVKRFGARTVAVGHPLDGLGADQTLPLGADLPDRSRGLLYMPFLQLLALERALVLGRDPDRPQNLTRVVRLGG